ncbi:Lsr2 family DNA-binding protein [Streptomyces scabiei]|uniref:Lsr2 family DNA-binding protein n=1 Tax=Streptomyces scabiei TaxID=1930 RepID=UPI0037930B16
MAELDYDPQVVKDFMRRERIRTPDDDSPVTPPELRHFERWYPLYEKRKREEAERRAEWERISAESRAAAQRHYEHKKLMRDMREWGRENGHFVGTRGRIPRKVIEAYKEAKGL